MAAETTIAYGSLGFADKVRLTAACGLSIVVFAWAAWPVLQPADSQAAVSFRSLSSPTFSFVVLAGLVLLGGGVGAMIAGPRIAEAGVFVVAVGLAVTICRAGTARELFL